MDCVHLCDAIVVRNKLRADCRSDTGEITCFLSQIDFLILYIRWRRPTVHYGDS